MAIRVVQSLLRQAADAGASDCGQKRWRRAVETEHGQGEALNEIENTLRLHHYIPEESSSLMMKGWAYFRVGLDLQGDPKSSSSSASEDQNSKVEYK